jgi:hypothetical protein
MAKFFDKIDERIRAFVAEQKMFFTASAPVEGGRVNLSPKGIDTFRFLDENTVCYLDLTGSGNETAAHVAENGRLTIMFCSFAGKPLILRLYGRGEVVRPLSEKWNDLAVRFDKFPGERKFIVLHVESLQTSCGFGVPLYEFVAIETSSSNGRNEKARTASIVLAREKIKRARRIADDDFR